MDSNVQNKPAARTDLRNRNGVRRTLLHLFGVPAVAGLSALFCGEVAAQESIKVGLVVPLTGALGPAGKLTVAGARFYMAQHGDIVAGRKIELIVRDDAGVPDNSKRITQELLTSDKVAILGGGVTPSALAIAPLVTESKTATVIMVSGTSIVTERSPYFVRTSFTLGQQASVLAGWAAQNGSKRVTIIATDWAPGTRSGRGLRRNVFQGRWLHRGDAQGPACKSRLRTIPSACP